MPKFEIKSLTFTTLDQNIRFINQLREFGNELKGSIFCGLMRIRVQILKECCYDQIFNTPL